MLKIWKIRNKVLTLKFKWSVRIYKNGFKLKKNSDYYSDEKWVGSGRKIIFKTGRTAEKYSCFFWKHLKISGILTITGGSKSRKNDYINKKMNGLIS